MSDYVLLNLRVSPEAREAWHRFAEREGVTASAVAEAAGRYFDNPTWSLSEFCDEARRITEERKDRKR